MIRWIFLTKFWEAFFLDQDWKCQEDKRDKPEDFGHPFSVQR